MKGHHKRPVVKWSATVTAAVALAFTVATVWYDFMLRGSGVFVGACVGQVRIEHADTASYGWGVDVEPAGPWGATTGLVAPWPQSRVAPSLLLPGWHSVPGSWWVYVPLWPFVLLPALVAGWCWWRERRPTPGHCRKCGYDLTGNVSGRCPECGTPVKCESKTP